MANFGEGLICCFQAGLTVINSLGKLAQLCLSIHWGFQIHRMGEYVSVHFGVRYEFFFSSAFLLYLTIAYLKPPIFLQSLHHRAHAYTLKFWFWFEAHSSWHRWRVFFQDLKRTTRCRWTSRMNMLPSLISSITLQPFCSEFWYMDFGA